MNIGEHFIHGEIDRSLVRGLLFDVDGTLSDTDDHMVESVSRILSPFSFLFEHKDHHRFARWLVMAMETPANFLYGLADTIGIDAPLAKLFNWLSQKQHPKNAGREHLKIIPGVKDMLQRLSAHYPMAVVSARDSISTDRFLAYFELKPYFQEIVTSQTCKHTKPYPDPVLYAAQKLGLSPKACLMIGDTIVDVQAGKSAGAQTLGVLCGFGTQRELKRAGADLILSSTPDLLRVLLD